MLGESHNGLGPAEVPQRENDPLGAGIVVAVRGAETAILCRAWDKYDGPLDGLLGVRLDRCSVARRLRVTTCHLIAGGIQRQIFHMLILQIAARPQSEYG